MNPTTGNRLYCDLHFCGVVLNETIVDIVSGSRSVLDMKRADLFRFLFVGCRMSNSSIVVTGCLWWILVELQQCSE
jgi:hypothetical protein